MYFFFTIISTTLKKPPSHLQPIENFENEEDFQKQIDQNPKSFSFNLNDSQSMTNKKITIPLDTSGFKDKDHINLDINLRLVDFLNPSGNRSLDDFNIHNDPLAKHIKQYETNISRSLPGSSGSLNKHKTLPPLSKRVQNTDVNNQSQNQIQINKVQIPYEVDVRNEGKSNIKIKFINNKLISSKKRWLFGSIAKGTK